MSNIRVLVAEDSATIRKYLVGVISAAGGFEVIGEADNGKQAIELCESLRPDVIAMDIVMPVLSGLSATEYIMAYCPTPILIVAASMNVNDAMHTYEALKAGAVDVLEKNHDNGTRSLWEAKLISTLRIVSRVKLITRGRGKIKQSIPEKAEAKPGASLLGTKAASEMEIRLIAVGASTGGPAAVAEILSCLPPNFPIPVCLVIHVSELFAVSLVDWLNTVSPIPVRFAQDDIDIPAFGQPAIIFAPAGKHVTLRSGRMYLQNGPERNFCRPSIDVLFESVAEEFGSHAACCLLTGMGKDGAAGLLAAKRSGAVTIAQDESSSIVFGMPAEAIKLGAADYVLPMSQIGRFVREFATRFEDVSGRS